MRMVIDKRYLCLPVSYTGLDKLMLFTLNGKLVYNITARLDPYEPDTMQYLDMRDYIGKTLEVTTRPEIDFPLKTADEMYADGLYCEKARPRAHFTSAFGWINDPNGLVWYEGQYHMFFQHNPAGSVWGNMHWGHAVSDDLVYWTQLEDALFPDEMGAMFSGSAFVDTENVTGLKVNEHDPLLLFYTACGGQLELSKGKKSTQCIAYSVDGAKTFIKYDGNPVVKHIEGHNRDPKVVRCDELGCYMMALYLDKHKYALLRSDDLLRWHVFDTFDLPEDGECPDIYRLTVDNEPGRTLWVFTGASDRYYIGEFVDATFKPVQDAGRLHYGNASYAAQTFHGIADGRVLRMAWNTFSRPEERFNCSMCTPTEMRLYREENGTYSLCQLPVPEYGVLKRLYETAEGTQFRIMLAGKAQDAEIEAELGAHGRVDCAIFGITFSLDAEKDEAECSGMRMPLYMENGAARLRVIADTRGLELYAGRGQAFMSVGCVPDYALPYFEAKTTDGCVCVRAAELADIWEK